VEAVVFPGKTRQILGLSALRQAAPLIFSLNPPKLVLSNCTDRLAEAGDKALLLPSPAASRLPVVQ